MHGYWHATEAKDGIKYERKELQKEETRKRVHIIFHLNILVFCQESTFNHHMYVVAVRFELSSFHVLPLTLERLAFDFVVLHNKWS